MYYYILHKHTKSICEYSACTIYNKILFKVLQCNMMFIFRKRSAESSKVKKQTKTGRNAFWFSVVDWFSASSRVAAYGAAYPRRGLFVFQGCVVFSTKEISMFLYVSGGYYLSATST